MQYGRVVGNDEFDAGTRSSILIHVVVNNVSIKVAMKASTNASLTRVSVGGCNCVKSLW